MYPIKVVSWPSKKGGVRDKVNAQSHSQQKYKRKVKRKVIQVDLKKEVAKLKQKNYVVASKWPNLEILQLILIIVQHRVATVFDQCQQFPHELYVDEIKT